MSDGHSPERGLEPALRGMKPAPHVPDGPSPAGVPFRGGLRAPARVVRASARAQQRKRYLRPWALTGRHPPLIPHHSSL